MNRPTQPPGPMPKEPPGGPAADLYREGDALVLVVSLPGLRASDFRISLVGSRQVYIEGAIPYRHPGPPTGLALSERPYGPFSRTVNLPLPVDPGRVTVRLERGVLRAHLPLQMQRVPLQWEGMEGGGHEQPR